MIRGPESKIWKCLRKHCENEHVLSKPLAVSQAGHNHARSIPSPRLTCYPHSSHLTRQSGNNMHECPRPTAEPATHRVLLVFLVHLPLLGFLAFQLHVHGLVN